MKLTNAQLVSILQNTNLMNGYDAIWNSLTPKQRQRAEKLMEKHDDLTHTWPKLKRGEPTHAPIYRTSLTQRRKTY